MHPETLKRRGAWVRPIGIVLLSPVLAMGFIAIGFGSLLLLVVERLLGADTSKPDLRPGSNPALAAMQRERPAPGEHAI